MGEGAGRLPFFEEGLLRLRAMRCSVSGKAQIPSAVVAVVRGPREGEDQQELSGLGPSLWEKEPDVCLLGKRLCRDRGP